METATKKKEETKSVAPSGPNKLVLHNDDFNTLEWVANCLIDVCHHTFEQAEQCTLIVHHKGKCDVKIGDESTLKEMKTELLIRQLSVTIERNG